MRILVACEFSGTVRDAFIKAGHDAMSCDIEPTDAPGPHYQGDIFDIINDGWDMMIAHPDCAFLANSGARWLFEKEGRWEQLRRAAEFFNYLRNQDIPKIAIENPQPHKWATELIGHYSQKVQPWWFGEGETKGTCLWLKGLPKLVPTKDVKEEMMKLPKNKRERLHYLPPGKERSIIRSKTFPGIADAMAEQWG